MPGIPPPIGGIPPPPAGVSSLIDNKKYRCKMFKELYFKRWKVETFYDELKNKLKVEYFSGYSHQSILQDFHAAIFISNVQTLIVSPYVCTI